MFGARWILKMHERNCGWSIKIFLIENEAAQLFLSINKIIYPIESSQWANSRYYVINNMLNEFILIGMLISENILELSTLETIEL